MNRLALALCLLILAPLPACQRPSQPAAPPPTQTSPTPTSAPTSTPASTPTPPLNPQGLAQNADVGFTTAPPPPSQTLQTMLDNGEHLNIASNTLTVAISAPKASSIQLGGGLQIPLEKVGKEGLWAASVQTHGLERLVLSWAIMDQSQNILAHGTHRGPNAPAPAPQAEVGRPVETVPFESKHLGQSRDLFVYRAPGSCQGSPLVIMADGQLLEALTPYLEAAALTGQIEPLVVIGVGSAPPAGAGPQGDIRLQEYAPPDAAAHLNLDHPKHSARFDAHMRFVTQEVIPWAVETFGVTQERHRRATCGFSNGAVFAAATAMLHPDSFGHAIALSAGLSPGTPLAKDAQTHFFLGAGTLEPVFAKQTQTLAAAAQAIGAPTTVRLRVGGHDPLIWHEETIQALRQAFPNPTE